MEELKFGSANKIGKMGHERRILSFFLLISFLTFGSSERCSIPPSWDGEWFISEFAQNLPTVIKSSENSITRSHHATGPEPGSTLGDCLWNNKDFYVFRHAESRCSRCVFITEKHANVLYSKEAYECKQDTQWDQDHPEEMCNQMTLNHHQSESYHFWFRKDYKPVDCPFKESTFTFSYRKADSPKCDNPISHASSCLDRTKTELHYEACHDQKNSVGKVEQIKCIAEWHEFGNHYFVGEVSEVNSRAHHSLRDRFRCYSVSNKTVENPVKSKPPIISEYEIGISGMATCNGLNYPDEGETVLYLKKDDSSIKDVNLKPCLFPSWLTSQNWINFDNSVELTTGSEVKPSTIYITPRAGNKNGKDSESSFFPLTNSQLKCVQKVNGNGSEENDERNSDFVFIGKYAVGCSIKDICLHFVRRSDQLFQMYFLENEMELGRQDFIQKCASSPLSSLEVGETMINNATLKNESGATCPTSSHGRFSVNKFRLRRNRSETLTDLMLRRIFSFSGAQWFIGCASPEHVEIQQNPNSIDTDSLNCIESWKTKTSTFTILATPKEPYEDVSMSLAPTNFLCMYQEPSKPNEVLISTRDCLHFRRQLKSNNETDELDEELEDNSNYDEEEGYSIDFDLDSKHNEAYFVKLSISTPCFPEEDSAASRGDENPFGNHNHPNVNSISSSGSAIMLKATGWIFFQLLIILVLVNAY